MPTPLIPSNRFKASPQALNTNVIPEDTGEKKLGELESEPTTHDGDLDGIPAFDEADSRTIRFGRNDPWRRKDAVITFVGLTLVLSGVVVVGHQRWRQNTTTITSDQERPLSARQLLESDEFAGVVTDNLMTIGKSKLQHSDREFVHSTVKGGLNNFTSRLYLESPKTYAQLDALPFSKVQRQSVLRKVAYVSDPRVQDLGHAVAKAAHESQKQGQEGSRQRMISGIKPRMKEIDQLRHEIVSTTAGKDENWQLSLESDRVQAQKSFRNSWNVEVGMTLPERSESRRLAIYAWDAWGRNTGTTTASPLDYLVGPTPIKAVGILAGVLEQCRIALDQVDFIGTSFGKDVRIPPWAKSFVGGLDFFTELGDCAMRSSQSEVKLMMCPMKYASALFDMMSYFDNMVGVANDDFGVFGVADDVWTTKVPQAWSNVFAASETDKSAGSGHVFNPFDKWGAGSPSTTSPLGKGWY